MVDILRVAIGLIITLTGLALIFSLLFAFAILVGLISAPDWQLFSDWYIASPNLPLNAIRNSFPTWTVVFTFLVVFIPALFVMLIGNSIIAKRIVFRPVVGWTLFVLFFISVAVVSFSLPQLIFGFKEQGEYRTEQTFRLPGKTAVLKIRETGLDDYDVTSIALKGYEGTEIKIMERFQSQGPSRKVAGDNAQMVDYTITQSDSILTFDSNITFKEGAKFRAQRLDMEVLIPYNQTLIVDAALWRLIDTDVIYNQSSGFHDLNQETQSWKMTDKGMTCLSCPAPSEDQVNRTNDEFGLRDFNSIDMKGIFDVRIQRGDNYAVEIKGAAAERKRYEVYVNGETLVIEYEERGNSFWKRNLADRDELRINITMPHLRELDVTGAGKLKFRGFEEESTDIQIMGAVAADGDMNASNLTLKLTGASYLDLNGHGKFLEADILGASGLRAYGYEVNHAVISAHGASMARVNATEKLEMEKGVASSISHKGSPEVIKR